MRIAGVGEGSVAGSGGWGASHAAVAARSAAWVRAVAAEEAVTEAEVGPVWLDDLLEPTIEQLLEASDLIRFESVNGDGDSADVDRFVEVDLSSPADPSDPPSPAPVALAAWVRQEWWNAPVRAAVRRLMVLDPGPGLLTALNDVGHQKVCPADHRDPDPRVESADPIPAPGSSPGWPCACQLVVAAAWQAMTGWIEVEAAAAVIDAGGAETVVATPRGMAAARVTDPARAELAAVLRLSVSAAASRLHAARELHAHPALVALAADATLLPAAWRAVLGETSNLDDEPRRLVIGDVVAKVEARRRAGRRPWTPGEIRRATKLAVLRLAPEVVADARDSARSRRRVGVSPDSDGMAWLNAYLPDVDAARIFHRLTAAAAAHKADHPDDPRCADERRADLLIAALLGQTTPGAPAVASDDPSPSGTGPDASPDPFDTDPDPSPPPTGTGPVPLPARPEIAVVIDAATLLGLTEVPARVPGVGAVPAEVARQLAADGRWRLWVTDSGSGVVTSVGSRTYVPSAALARLIRAREPHCRMPGCSRQAVNCDLDHTEPYPHGPTAASNLGPLCRTHHNLKTHHGYRLVNRSATEHPAWTWAFPSGLTHTDEADPPLPGP
ncbi:MAG: DUF222 domain-containing protein [Actinobacteria bacterium]|nr:DUF222 domain-containing protein [Actinomycetota bacterium]